MTSIVSLLLAKGLPIVLGYVVTEFGTDVVAKLGSTTWGKVGLWFARRKLGVSASGNDKRLQAVTDLLDDPEITAAQKEQLTQVQIDLLAHKVTA